MRHPCRPACTRATCRGALIGASLLFVVSTPLGAQPFELLGWGIQGGVSRGCVDYEGALAGLDPGWGTGATASAFAEFSLADGVRLQPGARYVHFKNHSDVDMTRSKGEAEIVLDCVSVPVLVKASIGGGPRLFFIAGPEPGFICKATARTRLESGEDSSDMGGHVNRIYVTLDAGLGVELNAGKRRIFVQGLYCHGILNAAKEGFWILDWKTREIAVSAGVVF